MQFLRSILILTLVCLGSQALSDNKIVDQVDCVGPENASHFATFLHGMGPPSQINAKDGSHQVLAEIALELNMRFALPRSKVPCSQPLGWVCWPRSTPELLQQTLTNVSESTKKCFGDKPADFLIGFSNGAFAVNEVVQQCQAHGFKHLFALGGAGVLKDSGRTDLSSCGDLTMLVGTQDYATIGKAKNLAKGLQARKARVTFVEFVGGHVVPRKELADALRPLLPPGKIAAK